LRSGVPNKNTVARLKSNIVVPQNFLASPKIWAGYATVLYCSLVE